MLVAMNAPCGILAARVHADPGSARHLAAALGCYEQIEPFIDDQIQFARAIGDEAALTMLNTELLEINQYRVQLAQVRATTAGF